MLGRITTTTFSVALFLVSLVSLAQAAPPTSSPPAATPTEVEEFSHAVMPITSVKLRGPLVQAEFASGFCLDPDCWFVGTNYHVAATMKRIRIKGAKVIGRFLATGPNDEGATLNSLASGAVLRYTWSRDLAIFRLAKPLRGYHGLQFSTDDLNIGERVEIYAYPKGVINPFRTLQAFHGTFQGEDFRGLMVIDYTPNGNRRLRPGASGGIVVDSESGKVVGIFCGLPGGPERGEPIAFAVPVESLAEFLNKTQPFLAEALFPLKAEASPDREDFYGEYEPEHSDVLQRRTDQSDESDAVRLLRERAQSLADGMRDFLAVQTFVWGTGTNHIEAADAYEVQVRDGVQRFREYPDGKKWRVAPAIPGGPPTGVTPGDEWSTIPLYIGTQVGVKIREASPESVDGQRIRIFQYHGSAEDEPCLTTDVLNFVFFSLHKDLDSTPYGEVWTDEDENMLRISLHCKDHNWGWDNSTTIVTYGWLSKPGVESRLVPVRIVHEAKRKKKLYWCRGQFVDYREFVSRARILSAAGVP